MNINKSVFINTTAEFGGAIHTVDVTVSISHSGFNNNTASWHGGASLSWIGAININNCDFVSNEVYHKWWSYLCDEWDHKHLQWSEFIHNDAGFGGVMYTFDTH